MNTTEARTDRTTNIVWGMYAHFYGVRKRGLSVVHEARLPKRGGRDIAQRDTTCGAGNYWGEGEVVRGPHGSVNCKRCLSWSPVLEE